MTKEDLWGLVPLVGIPLMWRVIDLFIPKGRHLKWIDRITVPDKDESEKDESDKDEPEKPADKTEPPADKAE